MLLLAVLFSFAVIADGFLPMFTRKSISHKDITYRAALRKTAEVCRDIAAREGRYFSLNIYDSLTVEKVHTACLSSKGSVRSSITFQAALSIMGHSNALIDLIYLFGSIHHVTDEKLKEGRELITRGKAAVKASVWQSRFFAGRWTLGAIFHTLQDFYSHSNWVELGRTYPYSTLINADEPFLNLAGYNTPTCRSCRGSNCEDNILPEILRKGLITTSYYNFVSRRKPRGKCSHGGFFDRSSYGDPSGGIHKDTTKASHGSLHFRAAALAVDATAELLEDIRMSVGDKNFLRLMGLSQSSVLCFVIGTSASMNDDDTQVKRIAFEMIDKVKGTQKEPPAYILVPFSETDFGPVQTTTSANDFKDTVDRLLFGGGGDEPEMCLSGLQLALTTAPPNSEIFVFTDAPAKDIHLKDTILALIDSSKSTVNFMRTYKSRRGRRSASTTQKEDQLYRDLSSASGGLAINVEEWELHDAMAVIKDSSNSAVVTVFQIEQNPRQTSETFEFTVDGSLQNVVVYITGSFFLTFKFTDPSGVLQTSSEASGPLGSMTAVGNLHRVSLGNQKGLCEVRVNSNDPYAVKVTGQSSVDFIFNLVEAFEGAHGDFVLKEGCPLAGMNATLAISLTGGDTVQATEVILWESSLKTKVRGALTSFREGTYLVGFTSVPAGDYVVIVKGEDNSTNSSFQRQASTRLRTSSISVNAEVNDTSIEPGSSITIPFTVAIVSHGLVDDDATQTVNVQVSNDRNFPSSSPSSLLIPPGGGGKASGIITLTAPASTAPGSGVALSVVVRNEATSDVNYATMRFSIIAKLKDIYRPVCRTISTSNCTRPLPCSSSTWTFVTNITDAGGSGIVAIEVHHGNGTLNKTTVTGSDGENITMATYTASCCMSKVVLAAIDGAGNVGSCVGQTVNNGAALLFSDTSKYFLWSTLVVSLLLM